jgi:hypothetical protein
MVKQKFFTSVVVLFLAVTVHAQKNVYGGATINNMNLPEKEFSFQAHVLPDSNLTVFNLVIQNPEKKKLQVQISHRELGMAVDTTIYSEKFIRRYNFNEADDGRYLIVVSHGKEKFSREIEIHTITTRNLVIH